MIFGPLMLFDLNTNELSTLENGKLTPICEFEN